MSGVHRLCYYCIKNCLLVRLLKAIGDRCFLKSHIVFLQIYTYFFIKNANLLILTFYDEIADKKTRVCLFWNTLVFLLYKKGRDTWRFCVLCTYWCIFFNKTLTRWLQTKHSYEVFISKSNSLKDKVLQM